MPTGQVLSSSRTSVPVPMRLSACSIDPKSMATSMSSALTNAVEAPPGLTARSS